MAEEAFIGAEEPQTNYSNYSSSSFRLCEWDTGGVHSLIDSHPGYKDHGHLFRRVERVNFGMKAI